MKKELAGQNLKSEFAERCRLYGEKFSRAEKQIANYILNNEEAVADYSIQMLAEKAKVGVASVLRFSKTLGYSGYADMKYQMQQGRLVIDKRDISIEKVDDANTVKQKVLQFAQATMEKCIMKNSNETLDAVSDLVVDANSVMLVGAGSSSGVAMSNASILVSMGLRAFYISDPLIYSRMASTLGPKDVLFAFSYSGYSKNVGDAVLNAKEAGATIVLVTAFQNTLLGKYADYELYTVPRNMENNINTSTTAMSQFAIMQIIQSLIRQKSDEKLIRRRSKVRMNDADKYDIHLQEIPGGPVTGVK